MSKKVVPPKKGAPPPKGPAPATAKDTASLALFAQQQKAQEALQLAIQQFGQENTKKITQLTELKKIKVDSQTVKYLMSEFNMQQPDVELLLRQNDNNLDAVLDALIYG